MSPMIDGAQPAFPELHIHHYLTDDEGKQKPALAPSWMGGLTKREYFAARADGIPDESTAKWVAECLGWPVPTYAPGCLRHWFLWWRGAEAAWKLASADALIAALDKS